MDEDEADAIIATLVGLRGQIDQLAAEWADSATTPERRREVRAATRRLMQSLMELRDSLDA